jgi:molybdate transport system substrate-binding protein
MAATGIQRTALRALLGICVLSASPLLATPARAEAPLVFAAASLKNALDEVATVYAAGGRPKPSISYAASSSLAKQIDNGAPADLFFSADLDWMDYLDKKGLLAPGTRRNLLGNRLVLVAPAKQPIKLQPAPGFGISAALKGGRIALADPASVPAGKYAKAAFEKLGVWNQVAPHVAAAENVRAALALVSRGETPLGVVYQTDAAADAGVVIAGVFPAGSHPPIIYPVAALKNAKGDAAAFLGFMAGARAKQIFEKHGFAVN